MSNITVMRKSARATKVIWGFLVLIGKIGEVALTVFFAYGLWTNRIIITINF